MISLRSLQFRSHALSYAQVSVQERNAQEAFLSIKSFHAGHAWFHRINIIYFDRTRDQILGARVVIVAFFEMFNISIGCTLNEVCLVARALRTTLTYSSARA